MLDKTLKFEKAFTRMYVDDQNQKNNSYQDKNSSELHDWTCSP